jgi:dolichyl-phosphate beta-glucosyltransferase
MVEVSVILPIFNASKFVENNIAILYDFLKIHYSSFEIVAVDDGSTDGTPNQLSAMKYDELRVIKGEKNHGKGYAVARGMEVAKGSCRVFTDVDLPYDLRAICVFTHLINQRGYHIVIGDRTLPGSNYYEQVSKLRAIASRIFATVIRLGIVGEIHDTQCGIKAFHGEIAQELFPLLHMQGFGFDVEALYVALKYNLEIRRIPVKYRGTAESTVNPLVDGLSMLFSVVQLPRYWRQGRYKSKILEDLWCLCYWE